MASIKDHKRPDGSVDWVAYHRAEEEAGERCYRCEGYIGFAKGHRDLCRDCRHMSIETGEVRSKGCQVRCPNCRRQWDASECGLFEEGCHATYCPHCDHEFEVSVKIQFTFISPALDEDREEP